VEKGNSQGQRRSRRLTSCTPEKVTRICEAIRLGMSSADACRYAGVARSTYEEWKAKALARPGSPFAEAIDQINAALAESELRLLGYWSRSAADDWRAAQQLLAVRWPERYSDTRRVQVTVSKTFDAILDKLQMAMSPAAFQELLGAIETVMAAELAQDQGQEFLL
jgi:hypothetical protein